MLLMPAHAIEFGPFGIGWLKPQGLFGLDGFDPLVHAVFWSLFANIGLFIGISLATKALFVGLTAFGMASMWGAIAADVGVSLLVVANALRLLNDGGRRSPPAGGERTSQGALAHGH